MKQLSYIPSDLQQATDSKAIKSEYVATKF